MNSVIIGAIISCGLYAVVRVIRRSLRSLMIDEMLIDEFCWDFIGGELFTVAAYELGGVLAVAEKVAVEGGLIFFGASV